MNNRKVLKVGTQYILYRRMSEKSEPLPSPKRKEINDLDKILES